jgi:hypothetical protein
LQPYIFITRKLPDAVIEKVSETYEVHMWGKEDVPVPKEILMEESKKSLKLNSNLVQFIVALKSLLKNPTLSCA